MKHFQTQIMCSTLTFIFANKTSKTIPQILTVSRVFHIGSTPQGRYRLAAEKKRYRPCSYKTRPRARVAGLSCGQSTDCQSIFYIFFSPCFPTIILVTIFNQWRCKISFYSIVFSATSVLVISCGHWPIKILPIHLYFPYFILAFLTPTPSGSNL